MTKIPRVTVTPIASGLLVACQTCGWERHYGRRPAADRGAHEHQKTCKGRKG